MDVRRAPRFEWGQRVRALTDLDDDGTHPVAPADGRLVSRGAQGEIVQIGHHVEADVPIYLVEFGNGIVVGCREEELDAA